MSVFIRRWHLYCQNCEQVPEQLIQDNINGMVGRKDDHTVRQHFSLNVLKKETRGWNLYSMNWAWSRSAAELLCGFLGLGVDTRAGTSIRTSLSLIQSQSPSGSHLVRWPNRQCVENVAVMIGLVHPVAFLHGVSLTALGVNLNPNQLTLNLSTEKWKP